MSAEEMYLGGQTTKRYDIPLSHLDYNYIEACKDEKELEKILKVLRSGDEGFYPDLEKLTEACLKQLSPKSRLLRKEIPIAQPGDLPKEEWSSISQDLSNWTSEMKSLDEKLRPSKVAQPSPAEEDGAVPIRTSTSVISGQKSQAASNSQKAKKRVTPRDYSEWERLDKEIEKTLEEEDVEDATAKTNSKSMTSGKLTISNEFCLKLQGMSQEERAAKAVREKEKGNESYRASDFEEAIHFYTRSQLCDPSAISTRNNRAMAYLQLQRWQEAMQDCNQVLQAEPSNIKALLRRGSAYQGQKKWKLASADFRQVLDMEPHNKRAKDLLQDVQKARQQQEQEKKGKGRRMVIEETEDSEEKKEEQPVAPPTATSNGHLPSPPPAPSDPTPTPASPSSCHPSTPLASNSKDTEDPQGTHGGQGEPALQAGKAASSTSLSGKNIWEEEEVAAAESGSSASYETYSASSSSVSSTTGVSETDLVYREMEVLQEAAKAANGRPSSSRSSRETRVQSIAAGPANSHNGDQARRMEARTVDEPDKPARRVLFRYPLLPHVSKFRREGNQFFKEGRYAEAIELYTHAINYLELELHQTVHLSTLYSNRAACKMKVGDSRAAKEDCDAALKLVPHSIKPLIRRAVAFETLEKFMEAYLDYKHACIVQHGLLVAQQGATRCQRVLQSMYGMRWREHLPLVPTVKPEEIPEIVDAPEDGAVDSASLASAESDVSSHPRVQGTSQPSLHTPAEQPSAACDQKDAGATDSGVNSHSGAQASSSKPEKEAVQDFDALKESGNQMVKKGSYAAAAEIYSLCLAKKPESVPCLTNRALCNLKLKKPDLVVKDCSKALHYEPDNIKALYRRALAYKEQGQLRLGMEDLVNLLKMDPDNGAAKREMEVFKEKYKEVFARERAKRQHARFEQRHQVQIEEFDEAQPQPRPRRRPGRKNTKGKKKSAAGAQQRRNSGETSVASGSENASSSWQDQQQQQDAGDPESPRQGSASAEQQVLAGPDSAQAGTSHPSPQAPGLSLEEQAAPSSPVHLPRLSSWELRQPGRKGGHHRPMGAKHPYWEEVAAESSTIPSVVKTTPYEFMSAWNSLKSSSTHLPYANLLRQTELEQLPGLITNKLDGRMLHILVKCAAHYGKEDPLWTYRLMVNLSHVQRFGTVSMMMSREEREAARQALGACEAFSSPHYSRPDLLCLKKAYGVM